MQNTAKYKLFLYLYAGFLSQTLKAQNNVTVLHKNQAPFIQIGDNYYLINAAVKMNWFEAFLYCRSYDSDLVTIETGLEMNSLSFYLTSNAQLKSFWINANDLATKGKYMSYSNGRPVAYTKWGAGQPDNSGNNENCVHLFAKENIFYMNDNKCTAEIFAICEKPNRLGSQGNDICSTCGLKKLIEILQNSENVLNCRA
ncbi:unnamed protein product [Ceratitis capitata]|uniref:(Mediterranean fruit fly) hypothetical protein n=1 Tax=Ceratitis capitata TaxID=7213 RepID=A0A811UNN4_CERCA|nr:unnamed protein product [Ceratitis capitata]